MHNPDGVELVKNGILSVPEKYRRQVLFINGESDDFSKWKANGLGVDLNNNFDAKFGTNVHSRVPSSSGFVGGLAESAPETKALVDYVGNKKMFFAIAYHSKGEEIYFNF